MNPLQMTTVGGLIKKIVAINPNLNVAEISQIIRGATTVRKGGLDHAGDVEVVDEKLALAVAQATTLQ